MNSYTYSEKEVTIDDLKDSLSGNYRHLPAGDEEDPQSDSSTPEEDFSYSEKLTKVEIFELGLQSLVTLFLQSMSAYYTSRALPYIHDEEEYIIGFTIVYALIASMYSIRMLYQLGPYELHMHRMNKDISIVEKGYKALQNKQNSRNYEIEILETNLMGMIRKEQYPLSYVPPTLKEMRAKEKRPWNLYPRDIGYFLIGLMTGFSTGVNFDTLIKITSSNLQRFLPLPIIVGVTNAVMDMMINRFIHGEKSVIASHLMISRAFNLIKETKEQLEGMEDKFSKIKDSDFVLLEGILNPPRRVEESKVNGQQRVIRYSNGFASLNLVSHSIEPLVVNRSLCKYAALSVGSTLPFLLSNLCVPFAAAVAAKENESNYYLFIALMLCVFELTLDMGWRAIHFKKISGSEALDKFGQFASKDYKKLHHKLNMKLDGDIKRIKELKSNAKVVKMLQEEKSAGRPVARYVESPYDFVPPQMPRVKSKC